MEKKIISKITTYEKFLRLPKIIKRKLMGLELEFNFDIVFRTKFNDDCSIEYNRINALGDYEECPKGCRWTGPFEECIEQAYQYFHKNGELLEDKSI